MVTCRSLDGGIVGISGEVDAKACLAIEGYHHLHRILDEELLVELRPMGIADAGGVAECFPQFLSDVRRKGSDEYHDRLEHGTLGALEI